MKRITNTLSATSSQLSWDRVLSRCHLQGGLPDFYNQDDFQASVYLHMLPLLLRPDLHPLWLTLPSFPPDEKEPADVWQTTTQLALNCSTETAEAEQAAPDRPSPFQARSQASSPSPSPIPMRTHRGRGEVQVANPLANLSQNLYQFPYWTLETSYS